MKLSLILFIITGFVVILTSCSHNAADNVDSGSDSTVVAVKSESVEIVSQKAYQRGRSVGKQICTFEENSREREKAIIEAHGMASALERNGYRQTAKDFKKGVHDVIAGK